MKMKNKTVSRDLVSWTTRCEHRHTDTSTDVIKACTLHAERQIDRNRQTDRKKQTDRDRQTETDRHKQTDRNRQTETNRQKQIDRNR